MNFKKNKISVIALIALSAIAVLLMVLVNQQKSEFVILKSVEINKPVTDVFPMINDLKNWRRWSPWYAQDSQAFVEYSENTAGRDAWVQLKSIVTQDLLVMYTLCQSAVLKVSIILTTALLLTLL